MTPGSGHSAWRQLALLWWSVTLLFLSVVSSRLAVAQEAYAPGEVLVSLTCGTTCGERVNRVAAAVGILIESEPKLGVARILLRRDLTVPDALAILRDLPEVKYAE